MRQKVFQVLNKIYGVLMSVSFFAGLLPLFAFVFALIVGGSLAETISVFLYEQYFPWVIIIGSVAIVVGWIAMYVGKLEGLSIKSVSKSKGSDSEEKPEEK